MSKTCWFHLALLTLLHAGAGHVALAHHGPEHVIEELSARIAAGEATAELYVRRADEHRTLRDWLAAAADYERALRLSRNDLAALYGLARTYAEAGQLEHAERAAARGVEAANTTNAAAPFHAIAAHVAARDKRHAHALASWSRALESTAPEVDWLLGHAGALAELGRHEAARDALADAMKRNKSAVLQREWVRALIRCGDFRAAEERIADGVATSRWKASWLLLRAQLSLAQGDRAQAKRDARRAASEINSRLTSGVANPVLEAQLADARRLAAKAADG